MRTNGRNSADRHRRLGRPPPIVALSESKPQSCAAEVSVEFRCRARSMCRMRVVGVGPERPVDLSAGGFLWPALRTGRATLTASGSPRTHATDVGWRLAVQPAFGSPVPSPRLRRASAEVRRYSPATSWHSNRRAADSLPSFAMWSALPTSDYYEGSAPSRAHQSTTDLPAAAHTGRRGGRPRNGSHVHHAPVDGGGAQLCPGSLATPTPQTFGVASPPTFGTGFGVDHPQAVVVHC